MPPVMLAVTVFGMFGKAGLRGRGLHHRIVGISRAHITTPSAHAITMQSPMDDTTRQGGHRQVRAAGEELPVVGGAGTSMKSMKSMPGLQHRHLTVICTASAACGG